MGRSGVKWRKAVDPRPGRLADLGFDTCAASTLPCAISIQCPSATAAVLRRSEPRLRARVEASLTRRGCWPGEPA